MNVIPKIRGWAVVDEGGSRDFKTHFFLDVNNAIIFTEQQKNRSSLFIKKQYMRPEWAEDLHERIDCKR